MRAFARSFEFCAALFRGPVRPHPPLDRPRLTPHRLRTPSLSQSLEKELAKEKSTSAAEAEKAAAATGAAAPRREVPQEMRARLEAAEKEAKAALGDVAGLEKKVRRGRGRGGVERRRGRAATSSQPSLSFHFTFRSPPWKRRRRPPRPASKPPWKP